MFDTSSDLRDYQAKLSRPGLAWQFRQDARAYPLRLDRVSGREATGKLAASERDDLVVALIRKVVRGRGCRRRAGSAHACAGLEWHSGVADGPNKTECLISWWQVSLQTLTRRTASHAPNWWWLGLAYDEPDPRLGAALPTCRPPNRAWTLSLPKTTKVASVHPSMVAIARPMPYLPIRPSNTPCHLVLVAVNATDDSLGIH